MRPATRALVWTLGFAAIVAFTVSAFTLYAQSRLKPSGTIHIVVTAVAPPVSMPSLATFVPDGGMIGSTIPLGCLETGQSMGQMHGQWDVSMSRGMRAQGRREDELPAWTVRRALQRG